MKFTASFLLLLTVTAYAADAPTPATATKDAPFVNSLGMKFVPVPGTKVLFSIWATRVKDYNAYVKAKGLVWTIELQEGPNYPVEAISWTDSVEFCKWLTETERGAGKIGAKDIYRLPSDHEWSCAVGIGNLEKAEESPMSKNRKIKIYPWGKQWPPPKGACSYESVGTEQREHTSEVGVFAQNVNGLYDMMGNVFEWCLDNPHPNPVYYRERDDCRIVRGSCGGSDEDAFLSSGRGMSPTAGQGKWLGFRCALEVPDAKP